MNTKSQASILIKRNLDLSAMSALNILSQKGYFSLGSHESSLFSPKALHLAHLPDMQ